MACQRNQARVREAALGGLDLAKASELNAHLTSCAECRGELDRERVLVAAIDRRLSTEVEATPSPGLVARVRRRVAAEPARTGAVVPRWAFAAAVALVACALVVGWLAHEKSPERSSRAAKLAAPSARPALQARRIAPLIERRYRRRYRRPNTRRAEPEVLIDPTEEQSLARFYNSLRAGFVDASSLLTVPPGFKVSEDGSWVPKPLEIDPLKIAPLEAKAQADADRTSETQ